MDHLELLIESESDVDEVEQDLIDAAAAEAIGRGPGRPRAPAPQSKAEKSARAVALAAEVRAQRRCERKENERRPPRKLSQLQAVDWGVELRHHREDGEGGAAAGTIRIGASCAEGAWTSSFCRARPRPRPCARRRGPTSR